jgi:hypothetical protein
MPDDVVKKPKKSVKTTKASRSPLTLAQWDALSPKAQWDIKVALRGPDCMGSEGVKWLTTSLIRGMVSQIMRVGGTVNTSGCPCVVVPSHLDAVLTQIATPSLFNFNSSHFFSHIIDAAGWMKMGILSVPGEKWEHAINAFNHHHGSPTQLEVEILRSFTEADAMWSTSRRIYQAWATEKGLSREREEEVAEEKKEEKDE